jgi:tetratricopeptide (TPR) repeat protein
VVDEAKGAVKRGRKSSSIQRPGDRKASSSRASTSGDERGAPTKRRRRSSGVAPDMVGRLATAVGPKRAERLANRMAEAAEEFAAEHLDDAARILTGIVREAPDVPEVRELLGLVRYRQGRWRPAVRELESFRQLTGSVEQNAVLADCYRALGNHTEVAVLWDELRQVSPDAALVTEGRIVAAGDLADQDRLTDAIALLSRGWQWPKRARDYHLRRAYALADLYERAGDLPAARALFERVAQLSPDLGGAAARADALR